MCYAISINRIRIVNVNYSDVPRMYLWWPVGVQVYVVITATYTNTLARYNWKVRASNTKSLLPASLARLFFKIFATHFYPHHESKNNVN